MILLSDQERTLSTIKATSRSTIKTQFQLFLQLIVNKSQISQFQSSIENDIRSLASIFTKNLAFYLFAFLYVRISIFLDAAKCYNQQLDSQLISIVQVHQLQYIAKHIIKQLKQQNKQSKIFSYPFNLKAQKRILMNQIIKYSHKFTHFPKWHQLQLLSNYTKSILILNLIQYKSIMKGFGFPCYKAPVYKNDTSKYKEKLIQLLFQSERLWNEQGKQQQSLITLRKAINILYYIIDHETIQQLKSTYINKLKELQARLKNRQENGPEQTYVIGTGGGKKQGTGKKGDNSKENIQLKGQLSDAIITEKPNVHWQDVVGLQNAKNALKQAVILPIKFPQLFTGGRKPWNGILLYGPPGTGKTFLAKACATEADSTFFAVSSSDLMSKWVGESQKLIKNLFAIARQKRPSIIFIDEIDSMCGSRSEGQNDSSRRVKTEFFVQMQGVGHDVTGVLILAATNIPWVLDPAIRRRFDRRIYIPLPQYETRLAMIKKKLKGNAHNLTEQNIQHLAKVTQDFSGSDIGILIRDAIYEPVRRLQAATKFKQVNGKLAPCLPNEQGQQGNWMTIPHDKIDIGIVTMSDFQFALKRTKASVDKKQLKQYEQFTTSFGQDG